MIILGKSKISKKRFTDTEAGNHAMWEMTATLKVLLMKTSLIYKLIARF